MQTDHPGVHWPFRPPYPLTPGLRELMLFLHPMETTALSPAVPMPRQPKALRTQGRQEDDHPHLRPQLLGRAGRHQPCGHPTAGAGPAMSTLTPVMLSTEHEAITGPYTRSVSSSITLILRDLRRELAPVPHPVISLSKHVFDRFFSITNCS